MVKINKVTTKTGDDGSSKIKKNKISKDDAMFSILGDFDELNASIAHCISLNKKERKANKLLFQLQNKLFDIGAEFLSIIGLRFFFKVF